MSCRISVKIENYKVMVQQEIIKALKNILGTFAYECGTDSQSYKELEKLVSDLESQKEKDKMGQEAKTIESVKSIEPAESVKSIEPAEPVKLNDAKQEDKIDEEESRNNQNKYNKNKKRG